MKRRKQLVLNGYRVRDVDLRQPKAKRGVELDQRRSTRHQHDKGGHRRMNATKEAAATCLWNNGAIDAMQVQVDAVYEASRKARAWVTE